MLSRVFTTVEREQLLEPNDRVLVAVSGGPDSTALLHALARLAPRLGVTLEAAVIDHGLRVAARSEAEAVAGACRAFGVSCELIGVDVPAERRAGESVMTAARRLRLGALEATALRRACSKIALGHTADDQAETVLFRIVRGTGLRGLSGIPYRRGSFVRPLLDVGRREVLAFLGRRKIPYLEDPSNQDRRFARSRVRHDWLPFLAAENPRIVEALVSLSQQARVSVQGATNPGTDWRDEVRVSGRAGKNIARLAAEAAGTKWVSLPDAVAEICYGRVTVRKRSDAQPHGRNPAGTPEPIPVRAPGMYRWWEWRCRHRDDRPSSSWRSNRRMGPRARRSPSTGGSSSRGWSSGRSSRGTGCGPGAGWEAASCRTSWSTRRSPAARRPALPVLAAGAGAGPILFVPGLRPSEEGRPHPDDHRWLEVRVTAPESPSPVRERFESE